MTSNRDDIIRAMEDEYTFPCFYPITLIARSDLKFLAHLHAALEYEQEGAEFNISERASRKKNYMSYHLSVYVRSADEALRRKEFLRQLAGVLVMF